jgi:DNA-binding Lrp family transcriptional regulator
VDQSPNLLQGCWHERHKFAGLVEHGSGGFGMKGRVRDIELRVLSALMVDGRISDRALAKKLGVSQPTVSRVRTKLEKEGYIREYTAIPDLAKLGYELLALTFVKLKHVSDEKTKLARKVAEEGLADGLFNVVMFQRGMGSGYDGLLASYHEDYSSYVKMVNHLKRSALEVDRIDHYLVSLQDPISNRPLTYKTLAKHILTHEKPA